MRIYAHRGSSGVLPENSLAAFEQAIADGADGVEFDLRATADGVPVVLHDRELDRTTTGTGPVDAVSLAELRRLDAGDGRPVPTLAEVLALLGGRLALDLEIKQPGIEAAILAELGRHPAAEWAISSFDWDALRAVRARDAAATIWPLAVSADAALFDAARELGAGGVALLHAAVTEEVAARCREENVAVFAWTVNEVAEARRLRWLGIAGLATDLPAAIRSGLDVGEGPR